ncbi:hypothetical protein BgiBS90_037256, partial [Biomphalaria glabrata]
SEGDAPIKDAPSPTSLYGLIIQAPLMSHFIASYTRAGVFCCLKAVLSSSPHIPLRVSHSSPLTRTEGIQAEVQDRSATTAGISPPRGILIFLTLVPAYLQATSNWLPATRSFNLPHPEGEPGTTDK